MAFADSEPLDIGALRDSRRGARIGSDIRYFDTLPSTNTTARELAAAGASEGVVVIAEAQTQGRGRLGRSWVSPPYRNLYMSIVLRPPIAPTQAPLIALVAGLASAEAIRTYGIDASIKWPNDVLVASRKVAGLLTEMDSDGENLDAVVLGIGVNVNLALDELPEELRDKAGSVAIALDHAVPRHELAARLLAAFERRYDSFVRVGFAAVRDDWNELSCLTGRQVEIADGPRRLAGEVVALAADGTLELRAADGEQLWVVAGEVTIVGGYERG